ncbi:GlxA family transcriptional regulator [Rhizobiaceae bacterium n13]|uniref:GlxA family transcriptional regulator n=1 Tax=Ferirhizobium litorale TaxID=2927786 RepID=A0AAE3QCE0_9HYPH|nr:GlxA family transcriptional regulator [Fererhizobium litorale]MDI7861168.1 GlxA family transcriptional regulator [Fererhizobium litorale]MDI7921315.1 GlxA family transcriptional regulator [Fererhizobium litorale]
MHRIGFVVFPGFQLMGFAAVTAFEMVNAELGEPAYAIDLLSEAGGAVQSSAGFGVITKAFDETTYDTVMFGAAAVIEPMTPGLIEFARRSFQTSRRMAAPCTGAFVLAESGLLDGRRATTHWAFARQLQERFPAVKVEEDRIFIVDGSVWTSAGMTAGIDLALAMVEKDHGAEIARAVARKLVVYHRRAGGQSQFSALLELEPKSDRIQKSIDFAKANLRSVLSVEELADAAGLSARQFSRAFRAETGQSPAKAVETLRVEAARLMMEQGRHSMDVIAEEAGFADRDRMRRAFLRTFGQPPQTIRRNARQGVPEHVLA